MEKKMNTLLVGLLVAVLLAACQGASGATPDAAAGQGGQFIPSAEMQTRIASNPGLQTRIASGGGRAAGQGSGQFAPSADMQTQIASNPAMQTQIASGGGPGGFGRTRSTRTATPEPLPTETPEPTATAVSQTAGAVQTAQDYFAALQGGDFTTASKLVSAFSLMANKLTAGDVVTALSQQRSSGAAWSDLQVADSQVIDARTILVHVTYQLTSKDAKTGKTVETAVDEQWPFRLENKKWLYNWSNIMDFKTLGGETKLVNGLTIRPLQLTRYSDKIRLTVLAQNSTNESIVIGSANQVLATFHFGSESVQAENTRYILNSLRSYTDVTIDVKGLFTSYPDSVELIQSKSTKAAPWFTFPL